MRAGSWAKTKSSDTEPALLHRARPARRPGRSRCRRGPGAGRGGPGRRLGPGRRSARRRWRRPLRRGRAGLRPAPMTRLAPGSRAFCPASGPAMPVAPSTTTVLRDRPRPGGPQRQPRGAAWEPPVLCPKWLICVGPSTWSPADAWLCTNIGSCCAGFSDRAGAFDTPKSGTAIEPSGRGESSGCGDLPEVTVGVREVVGVTAVEGLFRWLRYLGSCRGGAAKTGPQGPAV